jgi:hypothetical protein
VAVEHGLGLEGSGELGGVRVESGYVVEDGDHAGLWV